MTAARIICLTAAALTSVGCAGFSGATVSPGTPATGPFTRLAFTSQAAPPPRQTAAMAYYPPDKQIVLFGGDSPYRHGSEHSLGDTWVFDEHGWRRLHPRHSPPPRNGGLMAYDPAARRLLLFGGSWDNGRSGGVLSDSWAWNGRDWTQLKAVQLPTWMPGAPIAYDPAARRITELAPRPGCPCSQPPGNFHDSTGRGRVGRWLWTGRSWSFHAEHPAPGTLGGRAFAPDPLSGGMLYYTYTPPAYSYGPPPGAEADPTGTRYSQTWLWHDGHFTKQSPSRAPAWDQALMVSDARIGRAVIVGLNGRLWAWTGTTWQALVSNRGPQAGGAAVYDPALGDLVVFGTKTYTASTTNQTWLWNGARWIVAP